MKRDMHLDIKYTKVCALCEYWFDPTCNYIEPSYVPDHYFYDAKARCMCTKNRYDTYGGQPGCNYYKCKVK